MAKYLLEGLIIAQKFYQNVRSLVNSFCSLHENFGLNKRPSVLASRRIVEKFERNFTFHDVKTPIIRRNARSVVNIAAVILQKIQLYQFLVVFKS